MKKLLLITVLSLGGNLTQAAYLTCESPKPSEKYNGPYFVLSAEVDDAALEGVELTELRYVTIEAGESKTVNLKKLKLDTNYTPRTHTDESRYNLKTIDASSSKKGREFDGIIHGILLPKVAGEEFTGYVISSTDSYHDGINSYFALDCSIAVDDCGE